MELRLLQRLRLQRLDQLQRLRHQLQRPELLRLLPLQLQLRLLHHLHRSL